jgi:NAD(P)-dependent dehydrogenase (short-subunit alcohol dehydrogenase family)
VGVTAYFLLAREVMRHLRQRSAPGSIINMASIFGVVGNYPDAYQGLPVASPPYYYGVKGAVVQLTRHLAVYWARYGIRVNSISPGHFPRPLKQRIPEFTPRMAKLTPMGRVAQPEELKGAVVLLASDAGSYITGHNLIVDGGWTAW